ncbi:MAG TPA: tetratricopeptide repeat protein [Dehalococcoidia bacterium]|nr:tetratricopeptide repeat protein [Dehalococcoidia bacterium]
MADLPEGIITFLLTDIEGSTRLWERAPKAMRQALVRHDELIEGCVARHAGAVVRPRGEGDSRFAVFESASDAVAAACAIQRGMLSEAWPAPVELRIRIALHTGEADLREGDYYGSVVNRCARIRAIAHGGQTLLSQATAELARDRLTQGVGLSPLGSYRLKDLQRPETVYQLLHPELPADFPPLVSIEALPTNLPVQLTSFIGREGEMMEAKRLLSASRLLTLTGSGGAGKTRLALQVAADLLDEYADGVWLVELAALADPALVPQAVASALRLREAPGQIIADTLSEHLSDKSLLLVLDNCEHLVDGCAPLVEALLRACPALRVLATSRESLGVAGETVWRVPSLSLPEAEAVAAWEKVAESGAVRLFVDRARLGRPSFALTRQNAPAVTLLCRRLDGMPLAIELAAARLKVLSVEEVAARLDDRLRLLASDIRTVPARQQTLRATMDWSYELLTDDERVLFNRLSVFAGGFALEAAEAVCAGDSIEQSEVLELLARLVDKSLVVVEEQGGDTRYRFLETVRQYGAEKLAEAGEAGAVRGRHGDWFLGLVERAQPQMEGVGQVEWLDRLEMEQENLREALQWSTEGGDAELGLRLSAGMLDFWVYRGFLSEGRSWLDGALERAGEVPTVARARALNAVGFLARYQGDYAAARSLLDEGLALSRHVGDVAVIARSFNHLGILACDEDEVERAIDLFDQSLALYRQLGEKRGIAALLHNLAEVAQEQGDYGRALPLSEESLKLGREIDDKRITGTALHNLGLIAQGRQDYLRAGALHRESMVVRRELGDKEGIAECLEAFAGIALAQAQLQRAARLCGAAEALRARFNFPFPAERAPHGRTVAALRGQLDEDAFAAAWAEGAAMTLEEAMAYALASAQQT